MRKALINIANAGAIIFSSGVFLTLPVVVALLITNIALGVLGRVGTGISQAGVNIEHVSMDNRRPGFFTDLHFLVQVSGRHHLAMLMRSLRRIPDVVRIIREQE